MPTPYFLSENMSRYLRDFTLDAKVSKCLAKGTGKEKPRSRAARKRGRKARFFGLFFAYPKRLRTDCGAILAWASMAVPAWSRIWFLVKLVISWAISTSRMTDSAA